MQMYTVDVKLPRFVCKPDSLHLPAIMLLWKTFDFALHANPLRPYPRALSTQLRPSRRMRAEDILGGGSGASLIVAKVRVMTSSSASRQGISDLPL